MVRIYCADNHANHGALCSRCRVLVEYADSRLEKCPFAEKKPPCARCKVHCYERSYRNMIRDVMRYSGPRMMRSHPVLGILHLRDSLGARIRERLAGTNLTS